MMLPLMFAALLALAQPEGAGDAPQAALTPELVIAEARRAYRAGPVAELLTVRLETGPARSRSASLIVRLDARAPDGPPLFRLELDPDSTHSLEVFAGDGALTARNTDNENDRWTHPIADQGLDAILSNLPPLPVPTLQLALGDPAFHNPTPYSPNTAWHFVEEVSAGPLAGAPHLVLRGQSTAGQAEASFDSGSLRLREFRAELPGGRTLEIEFEPLDPGDPAAWRIPSEGRRQVASLTELAVARSPLSPGQFVPNLTFASLNGDGWSLHEALDSLPSAIPGAPRAALALIMFKVPADPVSLATSEASARLALRAVEQVPLQAATIPVHLIAAVELAAFGDQRDGLAQRWGPSPPSWATPASSINRFNPDARAILALIAPDRRLLAAIPLDDQTDAQAIADRITEAVR